MRASSSPVRMSQAPEELARSSARLVARDFVTQLRASLVRYDPVSHRDIANVHAIRKTNMEYYLYIKKRYPPGDSIRSPRKGQRRKK